MGNANAVRMSWAVVAWAMIAVACTPGSGPGTTPEIRSPTSTSITTSAPPTTTTTTRPPPVLSAEAEAYLREALDLMRIWSINRERVDWDSVEAIAFRQADGAETAADTYPAVATAVRSLRDGHSFFLTPSETRLLFDGEARFDAPIVEVRPDGLGYVSIGGFRGNIGEQADAYARSLATAIAGSATRACGWIVDLRENIGGNMWPMVAGLAPLLGEGEIGSFTYPDGTVEPWRLEAGVAWWDDQPMTTYEVQVPEAQPPVAVLIGRQTASSGEATAVAFRGRPNTRTFGQQTAGLTTSNEPLYLSDGAMLALTMSVFTDRTGHAFGQDIPVQPDQSIDGDPVDPAVEWLHDQSACAHS
ncbi:MAG TPA: S41 family peptidase [Acidimicrobiia bacterium]|nr:S41 family peptidase [Acidimicrobiia bacterium]